MATTSTSEGLHWTMLVLLCFGLFKEIRPSEPFLNNYLISPQWVNLTQPEVNSKVYPVYTYSYFSLMVPVFLLTDFVRYKPMVVVEGTSYVITWVLLLWGKGLGLMQLMQAVYGLACSTEVSYYAYIYAKVEPSQYKRASTLTRSAILFGRFLSGLLSQVLTSTCILDYRGLNYVSLACVSTAFCISFLLPPVKTSIYFHKKSEQGEGDALEQNRGFGHRFISVVRILFQEGKQAYSQLYVVKWAFWVAISTCVNFQVGNYIQTLWQEIKPTVKEGAPEAPTCGSETEDIYNGAIEASATLLGSLIVFAVNYIKVDWEKAGDASVILVSLLSAGLLIGMSQAENIWICYITYIVYRMSYQMLMAVASFEILKHLPRDTYGLVFGINMFVALGLQTILTSVVADTLALHIRDEFLIYGSIYGIPCLAFIFIFGISKLSQKNLPAISESSRG